ncbi:serine-type endopeptidase activity protein [Homalodisca vitripennis]|nr:serine-type endopeptidase activity protein [Homalodisca vitripennis]
MSFFTYGRAGVRAGQLVRTGKNFQLLPIHARRCLSLLSCNNHRIRDTPVFASTRNPRAVVVTHLQEARVDITDKNNCSNAYRHFHTTVIDDGVICAISAIGQDACQGDSGGPLMLTSLVGGSFNFYLLGVVSYGYKCAEPGYPGIYSKVVRIYSRTRQKIGSVITYVHPVSDRLGEVQVQVSLWSLIRLDGLVVSFLNTGLHGTVPVSIYICDRLGEVQVQVSLWSLIRLDGLVVSFLNTGLHGTVPVSIYICDRLGEVQVQVSLWSLIRQDGLVTGRGSSASITLVFNKTRWTSGQLPHTGLHGTVAVSIYICDRLGEVKCKYHLVCNKTRWTSGQLPQTQACMELLQSVFTSVIDWERFKCKYHSGL